MKYNLDFVKADCREELEQLTKVDYFKTDKLGYKSYKDAYIVPADMTSPHFHRGVLTSEGEIVQNSLLFERFEPDWEGLVDLSKAKKTTDTVIYLGWLEPVWGHIITDCLKKLWFVFTEDCKQLIEAGARLVAVIPWNSKAQKDLFDLIGIPIDSIENVKQLTQYRKIIIPDNSIVANSDESRYYFREYKDVVSRLISKIPSTETIGKVYFSRTSFSNTKFWRRREYGERIIENTFRKLGYKIIFPEKMNIIETLTMIRNCECFASTEGSISHNALFCKPDTEVIIVRKVDYVNRWQLVINQASNVNVIYIDAHQSIISSGCLGPFYMCVTKELEKFAGFTILHIPHIIRPSFWWYLVQNRRITKRICKILHLT